MKRIKNYKDFQYIQAVETIDAQIPLPPDIIEISNAYIEKGWDIFLVGGAVRDFIKGKAPKDFDLVTNALPEQSMEILKDFNVSDTQGKNFGVIRVYTEDSPEGHEIASYRRDISGGRDTKGDGQKVEMGGDVTILDDCMRRDITINALFYDIQKKKIVDMVGGIHDIKNGIIRAVGDSSLRFKEDRLRILRIFRFASRMANSKNSVKIDKQTSLAIKRDNRLGGIGPGQDVSRERIWEEIKKAWEQSLHFNIYLDLLTEYNMWGEIFGGIDINTETINSKNFTIVIANLFVDAPYTGILRLAKKLINEYRIDGKMANQISFLVSMRDFTPEDVFKYYKLGKNSGVDREMLAEWISIMNPKKFGNNKWLNKFIDYKPTVDSSELIERGIQGASLGREIEKIETQRFKLR
jgi:tRNA nucleotidyltransferase/poly(A) polymerase